MKVIKMRELIIPKNYTAKLSLRETQRAIKLIKDTFQLKLAKALNLERITAPLVVMDGSGINDNLNGVERIVKFDLKEMDGTAEIVQSLAKWKRMALYKYSYEVGEGIYTDMNAIRRDDFVDNTHSVYHDQWDWEKIIARQDRTMDYLKDTVRKIVGAIVETKDVVNKEFSALSAELSKDVFFITSQELEDMYPGLTSKERENKIVKEHRTVFISQIGGKLKSGEKHDGRSPDYDDWALNGDILFWHDTLERAFEVSSMGIRVDADSLTLQLRESNSEERLKYEFHQQIINKTLPLTIGGGIGQSRICMLMLEKAHIGEVLVSVWPEDMVEECKKNNIIIL